MPETSTGAVMSRLSNGYGSLNPINDLVWTGYLSPSAEAVNKSEGGFAWMQWISLWPMIP